MTKIFIDIFMYLFQFLFVYNYTNFLFVPKKEKSIRILLIFLCNVFLGIVYQFNITYLNIILMFVSYVLLFVYLYRINIKTSIFHSVIFMVVMLASELLTMGLSSVVFKNFNALESNISAYIFVTVISKLIYFSIMFALFRLFAQKESKELAEQNKNYFLLFLMPISSIMILVTFRYITYSVSLFNTMSVMWIISSVFLIFANIMVFIIYESSLKNAKELYDLKTIQHQREQDDKYFSIIEQTNKDMRIFAHDIENHFAVIKKIDNLQDIYSYIEKLIPDLKQITYIGISKNKMLDLIISKYITLCESKNIDFSVDVKTANLSYINDVDLSTLMNNLLDNAVESAEKSNNGFIEFKVFSKNKMYDGLIIINSCREKPKTENGILKTTKSNIQSHGIGISSVKKIIKKYNAIYDWKYDEERAVFETDIAFMKTE